MITNDTTGDTFKASALEDLTQASALIHGALQCMANLEGRGYCDHYEKARHLERRLDKLIAGYRRLDQPTGVFTI